jgi:IS30 family transposase
LDKYFYHAARTQAAYRALLSSCREGINLTPDECGAIRKSISPLLNKGQSVYQVLSAHPELSISSRSLYRHISSGVFKKQGVSLFSRKEQVNRKQFKGNYKKRKEPANYNGRRYADFLLFLQQHPYIKPVEMDTVYNNPGGSYIQTFIFPESAFMFGRLHSEKTNECMAFSLDDYQERLGMERFRALFPLWLTDRGSEFEKFWLFEKDRAGTHRLNIFYCDPMQSSQKPHVENNHNYVRDIIPNGKSLACLTQADIDLMFSRINSTPRKNLHGKTPFELFSFLFGTDIPQLFGIHEISRDDVTLKPSLLFKNKG